MKNIKFLKLSKVYLLLKFVISWDVGVFGYTLGSFKHIAMKRGENFSKKFEIFFSENGLISYKEISENLIQSPILGTSVSNFDPSSSFFFMLINGLSAPFFNMQNVKCASHKKYNKTDVPKIN